MEISYLAEARQDTVVNLTNHSYFNLAGAGDTRQHLIQIHSEQIAETDVEQIPTGWLESVGDTPYDLRKLRSLQDCLDEGDSHPTFQKHQGFDVSYDVPGEGLRQVAILRDPASRRQMTVETDQPALQFYSGQGLSGRGKGGVSYGPYSGLALETQHHPDSVNQEAFDSTILRAGESFRTVTVYAFSTY